MKQRLHKLIMMAAAICGLLNATEVSAKFGCTPDLHVDGRFLADPAGNKVNLHGVMDTPSMWFNGNRWTGGYNENGAKNACAYFNQMFDAITDTAQGSWCNIFRLHLEPAWLRKDGVNSSDESDLATTFDENKLKKYMPILYNKIAQSAKDHGMYVVMRPPGVCPKSIQVNGEYQKYLMKVWDIVTKDEFVMSNQGWLSIELANEPVTVLDANGQDNEYALYNFFQPIVDLIRKNGFTGIIWVPGSGYQSNYRNYGKHPINGTNIGYAVHDYPGWYNTSDKSYDHNNAIKSFQEAVPVWKTNPIFVSEIDWSPEQPGAGKYNEFGQWVPSNYGTWGTASTSKWGLAAKAAFDACGNVSMTLTHPSDYYDIDVYMKTGKFQPAFKGITEACGEACVKWFADYAKAGNLPSCDGTASGPQEPFNGEATALPGKIEAEEYDKGGEGKGYHDSDAKNEGGEFRKDGVDIKKNDAGNYSLGWLAEGEWLAYTVNIAESAKYHWSVNVATEQEGTQFHFQLDGKDITKATEIPTTGTWADYIEVKGEVDLPAGEHVLTFVVDNPYFDLDWIKFTLEQEPFSGTPISLPGKIEAEDFDLGGEGLAYHDSDKKNEGGEYRETAVDIKKNDAGNYSLGWLAKGEWLSYTVNIEEEGDYEWSVNVATEQEGTQFHLQLDGDDITPVTEIPTTGTWTEYTQVKGEVALPAGEHIVTFVVDNPYFDLDWISFEAIKKDSEEVTGTPIVESIATDTYTIYSTLGLVVGEVEAAAINDIQLQQGIYILKSKSTNKTRRHIVR